MSDFITLSCPSCGGKLEFTDDVERFACSYCGTENIVKRSGGIVYLKPLLEEVKKIRKGVDRTSDELKYQRLQDELIGVSEEIEDRREAGFGGAYLAMGILLIPAIVISVIICGIMKLDITVGIFLAGGMAIAGGIGFQTLIESTARNKAIDEGLQKELHNKTRETIEHRNKLE